MGGGKSSEVILPVSLTLFILMFMNKQEVRL